jgi:hypothetical protein
MKNILLLPLALLSILFVGCDVESPMDKDLYPQQVYIIGAPDKIVDRDLNIGDLQDTISISVAVSGSRPSSQDVTVTVGEDKDAIANYNRKNLSALVTQYRQLAPSVYSYPAKDLTIKAGQIYNTFPIYIKPATFHCDSLYMLPLKLTSTSAYKLNNTDTVALVRINMTNKYSGLYYMYGVIRNTTNSKDTLVYKMSRNLLATDNGQTVRMYHYNNEFVQGDNKDYRPSHTFKIKVNADNSLSFTTWKDFQIINGGGKYYPELKMYDMWYTFNDNGVIRKTVGYLYKARKTTAEQRVVDDWIEEHPLAK